MASRQTLYGTELVDCARANAKQGVEVATYQCGYGSDINKFTQQLRQACEKMNLQVKDLSELIAEHEAKLHLSSGEIIAPETTSDL